MAFDWLGRFAYETTELRDAAQDAVSAEATAQGYTETTHYHDGHNYGPGVQDDIWGGPEVDDIDRPALIFCFDCGPDGDPGEESWGRVQDVVSVPSMAGSYATIPHNQP